MKKTIPVTDLRFGMYVAELDRTYREKMGAAARRQREFWEMRAAESTTRIDSLEAVLAETQVQGGVTAMGRDASEAALAAGELLSRRMLLAVRLDMLKAWDMENTPMRQSLEAELEAVDGEISRLPGVGLRLAEAIRDLRIAEVMQLDIHLDEGQVAQYRTKLKVSFKYHTDDD